MENTTNVDVTVVPALFSLVSQAGLRIILGRSLAHVMVLPRLAW